MYLPNQASRDKLGRIFICVLSIVLAALIGSLWIWTVRHAHASQLAGAILHVDGSGGSDNLACGTPTEPCQTIAYGLNRANPGDVIRIAGGVYTENLTIGISITIEGGYEPAGWSRDLSQYETIIDGSGSVISQSVMSFEAGGSGSVLDGLTITGGSDDLGGGVDGQGVDLTVRNSLIQGNYASGGLNAEGGGGLVGGIGGGTVTIVNSIIRDNAVGQGAGGVRVHFGSLVMTNTLVADNRGAPGIHVNGPVALMHLTLANNDGGLLFNPGYEGPALRMQNSIAYGNGGDILASFTETVYISYSDIEGGWDGPGNLDLPPEYIAPANGNYHLSGNSPAIDSGSPAGAPPADLEGVTRDLRPDMGAFEYRRLENDLAVVDVQPSENLAVDIAVPVRATLYNAGNQAQTNAPVSCKIVQDGVTVYQNTMHTTSIEPLTWQVLDFPEFIPTDQGALQLTCRSELATDEDSDNDTFIRSLNVLLEIADAWVKDNPGDDGRTPSDLEGWYESPDLWVRNQDDGGLVHQDPIAETTNYLYARLRNRGTAAITGTVDLYWIEPSLGVRCGDWAYINTLPFSRLEPGEVRIVQTTWTPSRSGHTCLQGVVNSSQDPYNLALECSPLWVPWDNNVGWHNVNIISNPTGELLGAQAAAQTSVVQLVNVYNLPKEADMMIGLEEFPDTGGVTVKLPPALFDRWLASPDRWSQGVQVLEATKELVLTDPISATIGAIPLLPAEKASVNLDFSGPTGAAFALSVQERIDGMTVGGVSYQWVIPDSAPPGVAAVFPANGASAVSMDAPIVITFDEAVSPLGFDLAVSPGLAGSSYAWNETGTVVTATHNGLAPATDYSLSVTAKDISANAMAAPFEWSFTTTIEYNLFLPISMH